MNIDFDGIERLIDACESDRILQEALERQQAMKKQNTKEEAIIRLLIDLPVSG